MKPSCIKSCDSNTELPFDSDQGPEQQPPTLNPADADLQSASNQLYQHIPFGSAQGPELQPATSPSSFLKDRHIKLQP